MLKCKKRRFLAVLSMVLLLTMIMMMSMAGCHSDWTDQSVTPCEELITQQVEIKDLSFYLGYFSNLQYGGFHVSLDLLQRELPLECVREADNKYAVFEVAEGGRVYFFFVGSYVNHSVWVKEPLECNNFKKLKAGDTMADVAKIDSTVAMDGGESQYNVHWVMMDGTSEETAKMLTPLSFHLLEDRLVVVEYEAVNSDEQNIDELTRDRIVVKKVECYKDFVYEIDSNTMDKGKFDFSIYKQDMVK